MDDVVIRNFALSRRALIVAAAGCGKTELIARAISDWAKGRQLVLTHTHAGVRALRDRLKRLGAIPSSYQIDTLAGFALRFASSFPKISGCCIKEPKSNDDYKEIYESCRRAFLSKHIRDVLECSYDGVYVDEYQDCTIRHHAIVMTLAEVLPCRIVGDPLQGIFDFDKNDPLIDWRADVFPNFDRHPDLTIAYRWINTNIKLGEWLHGVRQKLIMGRDIDLGPYWVSPETATNYPVAQVALCKRLLGLGPESIAIIRKWPQQCYALGKNLRGAYGCMEEVECKSLMSYCAQIDGVNPEQLPIIILNFIKECTTSYPDICRRLLSQYKAGKVPPPGKFPKHDMLVNALNKTQKEQNPASILGALDVVAKIPGVKFFRYELLNEMRKVVANFEAGLDKSMAATAWRIRETARRAGRPVGRRTITRTLLVKGLEFDHVVLPDANDFHDAKNLYVALTRGSRSLRVLSRSRYIDNLPPAATGL